MTKFIHVCASQNDLFALDDEGDIYQYHFNVKTWVKLVGTRELSKDGESGSQTGAPRHENPGSRVEGQREESGLDGDAR